LELIFFPLPCASASWKEEIKFTKLKPYIKYTVKPVLRGHLWVKEKWSFKTGDLLKKGSIHMKISMTGQEKDDCLIEVTTWTGLTVVVSSHEQVWLNRGDHMNRFDCSSESTYHICLCILNITVSNALLQCPWY
jgi:hypothetical protein